MKKLGYKTESTISETNVMHNGNPTGFRFVFDNISESFIRSGFHFFLLCCELFFGVGFDDSEKINK